MTFEARLQFLFSIDFGTEVKSELFIILIDKFEPSWRSNESFLDQVETVSIIPSFLLLISLKRWFPFPTLPKVISLSQFAWEFFLWCSFGGHSKTDTWYFSGPGGRKIPFVELKFVLDTSVKFRRRDKRSQILLMFQLQIRSYCATSFRQTVLNRYFKRLFQNDLQ